MQKNAVIVAGGSFPRKEYPKYLLEKADIVKISDDEARFIYDLSPV